MAVFAHFKKNRKAIFLCIFSLNVVFFCVWIFIQGQIPRTKLFIYSQQINESFPNSSSSTPDVTASNFRVWQGKFYSSLINKCNQASIKKFAEMESLGPLYLQPNPVKPHQPDYIDERARTDCKDNQSKRLVAVSGDSFVPTHKTRYCSIQQNFQDRERNSGSIIQFCSSYDELYLHQR